jgi:citrate synthase
VLYIKEEDSKMSQLNGSTDGNGAVVARIVLPEGTVELPIVEGTCAEKAIDITHLRRDSGYITLDTAYVNTGSCYSSICFIDGDKGILRYRGIPIERLAREASFIETCYLLIHGNLPTQTELDEFCDEIKREMMLHEDIKRFFDGFPRDAHPMATLGSVVMSLSTFYQGEDGVPGEVFKRNCIRLLGKLPTIAAYSYKKSIGEPFVYPQIKRSYCENFLYMMFSRPDAEYDPDPVFVDILNKLFILHADHEQNCSTSTVRLVRSSGSNIFACIAAGICALWGPRHGGANEKVIDMLEEIRRDGGDVKKFVELAKDKNSNFRLMGFGHRVYKNFDPRAEIIKESCDTLLTKLNRKDELLSIAKRLEEAALTDQYFIDRKLYPNVDFYSGIIYRAMGIPLNAFTVMFALGRLPGWIANAQELSAEPDNRIGRPRQIYTGPELAEYIPIEKRG